MPATHIMQWIRRTVNPLGHQTLNAKGHVIVTLGRKTLSIQNEFHNTRTHCRCKKTILAYIEPISEAEYIEIDGIGS